MKAALFQMMLFVFRMYDNKRINGIIIAIFVINRLHTELQLY